MVCCMAGCKKEEQKCPSVWSAVVDQTAVYHCYPRGSLLDSSSLLFRYPANRTMDNSYELILWFKNEQGTQYLNSSDTPWGVWIYDTHIYPYKIYGLNGPDAHATITVTGIDSINQITVGQFSATLVKENSLSDSIRVKDGRFSITYELW